MAIGRYETCTNAVITVLRLRQWWNSVHFVLDHSDGVFEFDGINRINRNPEIHLAHQFH